MENYHIGSMSKEVFEIPQLCSPGEIFYKQTF